MATTGSRAPKPVPDATSHHRHWVVPAVIIAIIGLLAVLILQDIANRHSMEHSLTDRSVSALHNAGLDDVAVSFSGRDGTVWVNSAGESAQAQAVVSAIDGVRVVHVLVGTPGGGPVAGGTTPTPTPSLTLIATPSATPTTPAPSTPAPTPTPTPTGSPSGATAADVQARLDALPKIRFANNKATLDASAKQVLAKVAAIMVANPGVRLEIEGNADAVGSAASNLVLSRARAKAVYDRLVALGVPAGQLSTVGLGETDPIAPNDTAAHRALNRRVDFKAE
ncbi:MAG TPA: OmpA family protein [Micromonosporaceae bacterium]|nr:OmpA family protein [Micromonosporaceae bacterium]